MHSRSRGHIVRLVGSLAIVAMTAAVAESQATEPKSNTKGLLIGIALNGSSIDSDEFDDDSRSGGGLGLQLGWGFTPRFTLLAGLSAALLDDDPEDFVLAHFDLLARFNFRSGGHAFVPFLEGGFSGRVAAQDDVDFEDNGATETVDLEISGSAFTFGGGAHYYVTPSVAFTASLQVSAGEFSTVKVDDVSIDGFEIDATSTRLNLGLTLYPMRQR